MPVPFGVFRCIEKPTYDSMMNNQLKEVRQKKGEGKLKDILYTDEIWNVEA